LLKATNVLWSTPFIALKKKNVEGVPQENSCLRTEKDLLRKNSVTFELRVQKHQFLVLPGINDEKEAKI
jgi:hypothetical protein